MKKTLVVLTSILVGLFILLSVIDKSEYTIERKLWLIQKKFDRLIQDPKSVPDVEFDNIINQYKKVIKQYPSSSLTPKIPLQIGRIYTYKKDYQKAREIFGEIVKKYSQDPELCAEATANVGWTYELEKDWPPALATYEKIIAQYPLTETGMNTPVYIASYYERNNDAAQAGTAYQKAISFYKKVSAEYPNSGYDFAALRILSSSYFSLQEWEKGIKTLGKILVNYPTKEYLNAQRADLIIKTINTIAITQLQNYDIPMDIYQEFVEKHPKHPLAKVLKQIISQLKLLKDKNVQVTAEPKHAR